MVEDAERKMHLEGNHHNNTFGKWKLEIEGELEEQLNLWQRKVDKLKVYR